MSADIHIHFRKVAKRYARHWILKNITYNFDSGQVYGLKGPNGSGKSTLIKMMSGYLSPSVGSIEYEKAGKKISKDEIPSKVAIWGPYVSLIRELSIEEMVHHYMIHKPLAGEMTMEEFYKVLNLPVEKNTLIKSLSSGQEQRLGLALTLLCSADILLLDEPSSYLDDPSKEWMQTLITKNINKKIVIIASNDEEDLAQSTVLLDINDFR